MSTLGTMLCNRSLKLTLYNSILMEKQFPISLSLYPLVTTFLLSALYLQLFQMPHLRVIRQYLSFWYWLISLRIMFPRSIHVVESSRISYILKAEWYSIYVCAIFLSILLLMNICGVSIHWPIVNGQYSVNMRIHMPLRSWFQLFWMHTQKWNCWII